MFTHQVLSNQAMKGALRVAAAAVVLCATGFDSAGALFFRNTEDAVGAQVRVVASRSERYDAVIPKVDAIPAVSTTALVLAVVSAVILLAHASVPVLMARARQLVLKCWRHV